MEWCDRYRRRGYEVTYTREGMVRKEVVHEAGGITSKPPAATNDGAMRRGIIAAAATSFDIESRGRLDRAEP